MKAIASLAATPRTSPQRGADTGAPGLPEMALSQELAHDCSEEGADQDIGQAEENSDHRADNGAGYGARGGTEPLRPEGAGRYGYSVRTRTPASPARSSP